MCHDNAYHPLPFPNRDPVITRTVAPYWIGTMHSFFPSANPCLVTVTLMPYPAAAGAGALQRVVNTPLESVVPTSVVLPLFWNHPPPDMIRTLAPVTG